MVWSDDKRARFNALKNSEQRGLLREDERAELLALTQELDVDEEVALSASLAQTDVAIARMTRELGQAHESLNTLEQVAEAQRALRDEAHEYLRQLRTRRLALVEQARVAMRRVGSAT